MKKIGKVVLVVGIGENRVSVLAVCDGENSAQIWIDQNPHAWRKGYSQITPLVHDLWSAA